MKLGILKRWNFKQKLFMTCNEVLTPSNKNNSLKTEITPTMEFLTTPSPGMFYHSCSKNIKRWIWYKNLFNITSKKWKKYIDLNALIEVLSYSFI